MELVLDANILFSALLKSGTTRKLMLNNGMILYSPEFIIEDNNVLYFALALKLNCGIWSNDKELKNQDKIKVYSTLDLISIV